LTTQDMRVRMCTYSKIELMETVKMRDIRESLREYIHQKGYIQAAVAKKSGIAPAQLSKILLLNRTLDTEEFLAICEAMNARPDEIRCFTGIAQTPGASGRT